MDLSLPDAAELKRDGRHPNVGHVWTTRPRVIARGARAACLAAMLLPFIAGLDREEFHGDESHWLTSSRLAFHLVRTGEVGATAWQDQFYLATQPQVGKVIIGASLSAFGRDGPLEVVEYDWHQDPDMNRDRGAIPTSGDLLAARLPGAIAGWLGAVTIWAIGAALGRSDIGLASAVLLAFHPLWLANARRVGMDAMALVLGALAVLAAIQLARSRRAAWWLAVGGATGFAVSTKYTGLLAVTGAALPLAWHARREFRRGHAYRVIAGASIGALVAGAVVVGTNPALYPDPVGGVQRSLGFFRAQAAAMRVTYPTFASPALVAAEIVDRAIWPIGFPSIIDHTLERDPGDQDHYLVPGQYGTPVVGVGLALLLGSLPLLAGRTRRGPRWAAVASLGGAWLAISFTALVLSLPVWWERWHLGIVPAACLLAGVGLVSVGRIPASFAVAAQAFSALAIGPSFLNRGFWDVLGSPVGIGLHAMAGAAIIVSVANSSGVPRWVRARHRAYAVDGTLIG